MTEREVPSYFAAFIAEYFGEQGAAWLVELPDLLATFARGWELELLPPFAGLSFHYVAPVVRADGSPAVLKVEVPEEEARTGIAFLRLCNGDGAVCLLEADAERCALLMERAFPGSPLTRLEDDDEATGIAAEVMRVLWRPVPATHSFITVTRRLLAFARVRQMHGGGAGPLSEGMLSRAEQLAIEFDPKGVVGDPGYETGALMNNPYGRMETWIAPGRQFARRADILAERLRYPRERILAWTYTQAVLSASWEVLAGTVRYASWVARAEVVATLL